MYIFKENSLSCIMMLSTQIAPALNYNAFHWQSHSKCAWHWLFSQTSHMIHTFYLLHTRLIVKLTVLLQKGRKCVPHTFIPTCRLAAAGSTLYFSIKILTTSIWLLPAAEWIGWFPS